MSTYQIKTHPAYARYEDHGADGLVHRIRNSFIKFRNWLHDRNEYRKAVEELYAMTDRDLADIGIVRCDIEAIVRQSRNAKSVRY
jgi:uncharacterized protein YjiS (DUF1127 family)